MGESDRQGNVDAVHCAHPLRHEAEGGLPNVVGCTTIPLVLTSCAPGITFATEAVFVLGDLVETAVGDRTHQDSAVKPVTAGHRLGTVEDGVPGVATRTFAIRTGRAVQCGILPIGKLGTYADTTEYLAQTQAIELGVLGIAQAVAVGADHLQPTLLFIELAIISTDDATIQRSRTPAQIGAPLSGVIRFQWVEPIAAAETIRPLPQIIGTR
ncbi:hypothetical protein D3C78_1065300 [compost metagenome]